MSRVNAESCSRASPELGGMNILESDVHNIRLTGVAPLIEVCLRYLSVACGIGANLIPTVSTLCVSYSYTVDVILALLFCSHHHASFLSTTEIQQTPRT